MDKVVRITLKKSSIGWPKAQRMVLRGLGLTRTGKVVVRKDTPEIRGMINKVIHLVKVQE